MYLHLGQGVMVAQKDIVGIFDLDNCSISKRTRNFLSFAEQSGKIRIVGEDIPKSFTVTSCNGKITVYLSQISSATLLKRSSLTTFE